MLPPAFCESAHWRWLLLLFPNVQPRELNTSGACWWHFIDHWGHLSSVPALPFLTGMRLCSTRCLLVSPLMNIHITYHTECFRGRANFNCLCYPWCPGLHDSVNNYYVCQVLNWDFRIMSKSLGKPLSPITGDKNWEKLGHVSEDTYAGTVESVCSVARLVHDSLPRLPHSGRVTGWLVSQNRWAFSQWKHARSLWEWQETHA